MERSAAGRSKSRVEQIAALHGGSDEKVPARATRPLPVAEAENEGATPPPLAMNPPDAERKATAPVAEGTPTAALTPEQETA